MPVIAGGVEASLRRLAHYDYWSDTVRRSILLDCQGRPGRLRHGRAARSSRSPAASPPARRSRTCATCAAWPIALGASETPPGRARSCCPRFEEVKADKRQVRRGDPDHPPGHQPAQRHDRSSSTTTARPSSATRRRCRSARTTWTGSTACPTPAGRTRRTRRADPGLRDDQGLGDDHARLLRRLHVLLDHRPPGADHPVAVAGVGPRPSCAQMAARPEVLGRRLATSAARPPTCTRCAAPGPRSRRSASGSRASIRRSASCSAPTTARSSS